MRARAALIGSLVLVWSLSGSAQSRQPIPPSELEDQVLGWTKVYDYKGATKPITVDTRLYSPQFDAMSFDLQGNTADERMFISNIRIANN